MSGTPTYITVATPPQHNGNNYHAYGEQNSYGHQSYMNQQHGATPLEQPLLMPQHSSHGQQDHTTRSFQSSYNDGGPQFSEKGGMGASGYRATPPMTLSGAVGHRNAKNLPLDGQGKRDWSNGLCGCGFGNFCMSCWCPCIAYSKNKQRYKHLNTRGIPDPEQGGSSCTGDCWMHCCLTSFFGAGWILQIGLRSNIRQRYGIRGSGCGDCCSAFCCNPCELAQGSAELELEERAFAQSREVSYP